MASRQPQRRQSEDNGSGTPGWIVSWTDMVTLLLSFFVMLQSMATEKSDRLFELGRGSFIRALSGWGIPDWLYGQDPPMPSRQYKHVKHPMEQREPEKHDRVIDAEDEKIRRLFNELREAIEMETSDLSERMVRVDAPDVRFGPGGSTLNGEQRELLADYADTLRQNLAGGRIRIYVVGLAPDVGPTAERWVVSARRARAAGAVLQRVLAEQLTGAPSQRWDMDSWGAANDGGAWCRRAGAAAGRAQVVIAVMEIQ